MAESALDGSALGRVRGVTSPKDDDSNTDDDTKTGIDGSMDDSDSK